MSDLRHLPHHPQEEGNPPPPLKRTGKPAPAPGAAKRRRAAPQDEGRRKEIRETNRIAARECRARKKHLMVELERTVANLTTERQALLKQNRELSIRLDTLERSAALGMGPMAGAMGAAAPRGAVRASGFSPSVLSANPALANAALGNPALSHFSANPYQSSAAAAAPAAAGAGPRVVIQHVHHYGKRDGSGAPSPALRAAGGGGTAAGGASPGAPSPAATAAGDAQGHGAGLGRPERPIGLAALASLAQRQAEAAAYQQWGGAAAGGSPFAAAYGPTSRTA